MSVTSRQRPVPPSMFSDETLMELAPDVRLTGLGLRFYVDDHGRGSATPALIRGQLWPLSEEITDATIEEHLEWLEQAGYIEMYAAEGRVYLSLIEWPAVDRPAKSRIPAPPNGPPTLATPSRTSRDSLAVMEEREERGEREGEGEGRKSEREQGEDPTSRQPDPTSPFCPKHQPYGTDRKCGPCGRARLAHDVWLRQQADAASADLDESDD